ncbi:hypothetical protein [Porphyromonas asaccharolytica]|nr:hypothetical protein [Porphyromonas asaccharolytica]
MASRHDNRLQEVPQDDKTNNKEQQQARPTTIDDQQDKQGNIRRYKRT